MSSLPYARDRTAGWRDPFTWSHTRESSLISGKPRQGTGNIKCNGDDVYRLDARGSRPNAVWEYPYRLPIFSPIDEPERGLDNDGFFWVRNTEEWDYIWVAASGEDLGLDCMSVA